VLPPPLFSFPTHGAGPYDSRRHSSTDSIARGMLFLTKLLRAGAFAVSVLAYSYLELIDLSGLAPGNGIESGHGTENGKGGDFLTASMGAAGITLPPASVMRWVRGSSVSGPFLFQVI